jgi:hypothetical protein
LPYTSRQSNLAFLEPEIRDAIPKFSRKIFINIGSMIKMFTYQLQVTQETWPFLLQPLIQTLYLLKWSNTNQCPLLLQMIIFLLKNSISWQVPKEAGQIIEH